jgi:CAI-1 autoinducer synthase
VFTSTGQAVTASSNSTAKGGAPLSPALLQRVQSKFVTRWENEWGGSSLLHGKTPGPNAVRLDGNDYLGISGHPDIVRAQVAALSGDSHYVVQSGIFHFDEHPSRTFEKTLAQWMGHEDGVLCQSGYMANVGLLQAIADEQTPVYIDSLAHMSLWEGARAAKAPTHAFRHNDPEHLDRQLARHGAGVVVVDSVYSTTGALCPLVQMVQVCERHGAMIVVDESHSLGTHGPHGAGLCVQLGLSERVQFITASLAKAFAARAGFFTVAKHLRNYVISESFPAIFSSSLLPHEIAALHATLKVIHQADGARSALHRSTKRLRASLADMGYPIFQGTEQIISLEAGEEPRTKVLRDQLEKHEVFGAVFCAPATSRNRSMVRLTLNANLTEAELDHIEQTASRIFDVVRPDTWPIARKAGRMRTGEPALMVA